jgi:trigger factor
MQVSVETTSELSRKMTVIVPEDKIRKQVDSRLQSLSSKAKIDGFRPGKVPQAVVRKRYGQQVREEVVSDLIQSSFYEAVRDEKLNPAGAPQIKANKIDEGEGLEYEASFEIMPEFVPMPLETLEVKRFTSSVGDEDIQGMIQRLREQRKSWKSVDRASAKEDRVVIAFEGTQGEESFTNGRVEDFPVVLGSGQMIPGFEDKLSGLQAGTKLEFDIDFPAEYPGEKLAGKTGHFAVDVIKVEEAVVPELDAEFIKSFGVESGELSGFQADIRANMEREMKRALKSRTKSSVMDQLFDRNSIQLPQVLVQDELNDLLKPYHESARKHKQPLDEEAMKPQLEPLARRRVALALILGKLIDAHGVKVDPARVRSAVEDLAASYEDADEVVRWYYADASRLREVENMVLEDQVVDLILDKAKTKEESIDFQALMTAATGASLPGQA